MAGEQSAYSATGNPILITDTYMSDIADAIRAKTGSVDTYTPAQMASAISAIETGGGSSAYNALIGNEAGNYSIRFYSIGSYSGPHINLDNFAGITDKRQIRYMVMLGGGSSYSYVYDRAAWLDYSYRSAYSSRTIVPLSYVNPTVNYNNASHHKLFTDLYASPAAGHPGLLKSELEGTTKTLYLYYMDSSGNDMSKITSSSSLYLIIVWDKIDSIPTE